MEWGGRRGTHLQLRDFFLKGFEGKRIMVYMETTHLKIENHISTS